MLRVFVRVPRFYSWSVVDRRRLRRVGRTMRRGRRALTLVIICGYVCEGVDSDLRLQLTKFDVPGLFESMFTDSNPWYWCKDITGRYLSVSFVCLQLAHAKHKFSLAVSSAVEHPSTEREFIFHLACLDS